MLFALAGPGDDDEAGLVVNLLLVPSKPSDFHLFSWSSHDFENFISPWLPRICSECYEFKARIFQAILVISCTCPSFCWIPRITSTPCYSDPYLVWMCSLSQDATEKI